MAIITTDDGRPITTGGPLVLNIAEFRTTYRQFLCNKQYSDDFLKSCFLTAADILAGGRCPYGNVNFRRNVLPLILMTAHLAAIGQTAARGGVSGVLTDATIDKVSVSIAPPPERDQWQWFLNQTSYGQQLLAFLQRIAVGGFYSGGSLDLAAFRRPARLR